MYNSVCLVGFLGAPYGKWYGLTDFPLHKPHFAQSVCTKAAQMRLPGDWGPSYRAPWQNPGASSRDEMQDGLGVWICLMGPQDVTVTFTKASVTSALRCLSKQIY